MDRGAFIAGTLSLLAAPLAAEAQPAQRVHRVGFLGPGSAAVSAVAMEAFRRGLREFGYVEGQTIVIEWRFADGRMERLPDLATELVSLKVNVLVASHAEAARSLRLVTQTIPIVLTGVDLRLG